MPAELPGRLERGCFEEADSVRQDGRDSSRRQASLRFRKQAEDVTMAYLTNIGSPECPLNAGSRGVRNAHNQISDDQSR